MYISKKTIFCLAPHFNKKCHQILFLEHFLALGWLTTIRPQRTHLYRFIQLAIFSDYKKFISLDSLVYTDQ